MAQEKKIRTRGDIALEHLREHGRMTHGQWSREICLCGPADRCRIEAAIRKTKRHVFPLGRKAEEVQGMVRPGQTNQFAAALKDFSKQELLNLLAVLLIKGGVDLGTIRRGQASKIYEKSVRLAKEALADLKRVPTTGSRRAHEAYRAAQKKHDRALALRAKADQILEEASGAQVSQMRS